MDKEVSDAKDAKTRGRIALHVSVPCLAVLMAVGALWSPVIFVVSALALLVVTLRSWRRSDLSWGGVLMVAVIARVIMMPLPPALSDDGYRYVWDGRLTVSGTNPYTVVPTDPSLAHWHDGEVFDSLNSPEFYTVYPPLSQVIYALAALLGGSSFLLSWYIIKGLLVALEVVGLVVLLRLVSPALAVLYAWNPLVIMETAGQGHAEGAMAALLILSVGALPTGRRFLAGVALAGAGMLKLWPFVLAALTKRAGWRFWLALGSGSALLTIPFLTTGVAANVLSSLDLYVDHFEWYAGPYFAARIAIEELVGGNAGALVGRVLRGAFMLGALLIWWAVRRYEWRTAVGWYALAGWFIVTATTVHPWYLIGVMALLVISFRDSAVWRWQVYAWQVLAAGAIATYLFYWYGTGPYWAAVWMGWTGWTVAMITAGAIGVLPSVMKGRGRDKWRWIQPHVLDVRTLIDVGAGEGFVAEAAHEDGFYATCADVIDLQQVDLPRLEIKDGRIPSSTDAFEVGLLVFVLHHAEEPIAVLKEVRRVVSKRIVVVESIADSAWDRWWLPWADRVANRLRSGGRMNDQEEHLEFRTADEWRRTFAKAGLHVITETRRGSPLHRQHLFVLEAD